MTQLPHDKVVAARLAHRLPFTRGAMRLAQHASFRWTGGQRPDSHAMWIGKWHGRTPFVIEKVALGAGHWTWRAHAPGDSYDAATLDAAQQWCEIKARQWLALMLTPVKAGRP